MEHSNQGKLEACVATLSERLATYPANDPVLEDEFQRIVTESIEEHFETSDEKVFATLAIMNMLSYMEVEEDAVTEPEESRKGN